MISILLPTYNASAALHRSIRSMLVQTFADFELLILDDGSTDDTETVVRKTDDDRIRYIRLSHNGLSAALNEGIRLARFDILARMDAGDIAFPNRLQRQLEVLNQSNERTIVSCRYGVFAGESVQYLVVGASDPIHIKQRLALHPDFPHQGVMYRKEFIVAAGMYRTVPLEDYDLWLRVMGTAEFRVVPEVLMLVEHSGRSLTNSDVRGRYRDHYALQQMYFSDLSSFGIVGAAQTTLTIGWREYFYGSPKNALNAWRKLGLGLVLHPRVLIAIMVMLILPTNAFITFKEQRIRQRLSYLLRYFSAPAATCRSVLRQSLSAEDLR